EQHAHQIRQNTEDWDEHMLETAERVVFAERDDGDDARHHIKEECTKVAHKRDHNGTLWDLGSEIMAPNAKAVPDVVGQGLDCVICGGSGAGEIEEDCENRNGC